MANSLKDALVEMKAEGADEFVLDLRGNGGGAFQSALGVAGLFMDAKPITYVVRVKCKGVVCGTWARRAKGRVPCAQPIWSALCVLKNGIGFW